MNLSAPFVARPVATTLLTIGLALAGAVAFLKLPVSPLPKVEFPTISVSAGLPGAAPETVATSLTTPLERALGAIAGVTEITSSSTVGNARITLQFDLSRSIDGAARDVQAAINAARMEMPGDLPSNPQYRKINPADAPALVMAVTSDTLGQGRLYDAASNILQQKLSQVDGVGQVTLGGSSLPAVRVELNPTSLAKYRIGLESVRAALAAANANSPKGAIEDGDRRYQLYSNDQARTASDYRPLIIAWRNGSPVRLSDVAEVLDSTENIRNEGQANGKRSVLVIVYLQPNANVIESVDAVKALLPELRAALPNDVSLDVVADRTTTIRASLREVEHALLISIALVVLVTFAFLRSARAGLVAAVAVPVSLIATFGGMYLLGYSLNNLSLMAMAIAAGFVVDDAIIVLENVSRHIEGRHVAHRRRPAGGPRGRLHRGLDEPVADRRLHAHPSDVGHRRPAVPRVRRHALDRHPGLDGGVAHHHADDVRLRAAAARIALAGAVLPLERARLRRPAARLCRQPGPGAAPPAAHHAGVPGDGDPEHRPLRDHSQGLSSRSRTRAASSAASAPTRASRSRPCAGSSASSWRSSARIRRSRAWPGSPAATRPIPASCSPP